MATTARGFRYPVAADSPDIPRDIGNLAADVDGMFLQGTSLPAFGKVGREYYRTTDKTLWLDIGTAWVQKNSPSDGVVASRQLKDPWTRSHALTAGVDYTLTTSYVRINRVILPAPYGVSGASTGPDMRIEIQWHMDLFWQTGAGGGYVNFQLQVGSFGVVLNSPVSFGAAASMDDVLSGSFVTPSQHDADFDVEVGLYVKKDTGVGFGMIRNNNLPSYSHYLAAKWVGA